jgi:hypothetical protein
MSVEFSAEQRAFLGIGEGESVRVLTTTPGVIQLERVGEDGPRAYPWDRDLVLTADIRAFSVADVLHWVHSASKSGFLAFENGKASKAVFLHRGEVVFASSNLEVDRLGPSLLRAGSLTADQYKEAERVYKHTGQFGKVLIDRGFLTPREIWNGVKAQVEEIVRSLFVYGSGSVLFWEGEARPDNVVRLSLPTRRLIEEGLKRRNELLKFLALVEDPRIQLLAVDGAGLAGSERAIYESFRAGRDFAAVCRDVGIDPLTVARTVQLLRLLGAITVERRPEGDAHLPQADVRFGDDEAVRECVDLHVKILCELATPIVAVEGSAALRSRLAQVTEEAASRHPALLSGVTIGPSGMLDPTELIERALRFPGDREAEVTLALGELVAYMEFDLSNHPDIEDPDLFLEALEPLRAQL